MQSHSHHHNSSYDMLDSEMIELESRTLPLVAENLLEKPTGCTPPQFLRQQMMCLIVRCLNWNLELYSTCRWKLVVKTNRMHTATISQDNRLYAWRWDDSTEVIFLKIACVNGSWQCEEQTHYETRFCASGTQNLQTVKQLLQVVAHSINWRSESSERWDSVHAASGAGRTWRRDACVWPAPPPAAAYQGESAPLSPAPLKPHAQQKIHR